MAYKTLRRQRKEFLQNFAVLFSLILGLLIIGMFVYHYSEGWSWLDSLYFATISLTSRGYSAMHPTTVFSVIFSIFYLIIGVSIVIYAISLIVSYYSAVFQPRIGKKINKILNKKERETGPKTKILFQPRKYK